MNLIARKCFQQVLVPAVIVVALAACDSSSANPTATVRGSSTPTAPVGNLTTVRLGYRPVPMFAPIYIAKERGYFAQQGIDLQLTALQSDVEPVVQLANGNFDAALGEAGAGMFSAASRGTKFTIVAPMYTERPPDATPLVISAKRAGEFLTVLDLKGKKVGIDAAGADTEYLLAKALATKGVKMGEVQLKTVAFADMPAALESGSLDAAMLVEPLATISEQNGTVKVLNDSYIDGFYSSYLYMGDPLLRGKPDKALGFMKAYLKACRDLQGNYMSDDIAGIISKYTQVPAGVIKVARPAQYDPNGRVPIEDLSTLQDYFASRDELKYTPMLDLSRLTNTTLASQAATALDANK